MTDPSIEKLIDSATPEYEKLKATNQQSPKPLEQLLSETTTDESAIPGNPEELAKYYASQNVMVAVAPAPLLSPGEPNGAILMVDAYHCREVELEGLRDHQRIIQLSLEREVWLERIRQDWQEKRELCAQIDDLKKNLATAQAQNPSTLDDDLGAWRINCTWNALIWAQIAAFVVGVILAGPVWSVVHGLWCYVRHTCI